MTFQLSGHEESEHDAGKELLGVKEDAAKLTRVLLPNTVYLCQDLVLPILGNNFPGGDKEQIFDKSFENPKIKFQ